MIGTLTVKPWLLIIPMVHKNSVTSPSKEVLFYQVRSAVDEMGTKPNSNLNSLIKVAVPVLNWTNTVSDKKDLSYQLESLHVNF